MHWHGQHAEHAEHVAEPQMYSQGISTDSSVTSSFHAVTSSKKHLVQCFGLRYDEGCLFLTSIA